MTRIQRIGRIIIHSISQWLFNCQVCRTRTTAILVALEGTVKINSAFKRRHRCHLQAVSVQRAILSTRTIEILKEQHYVENHHHLSLLKFAKIIRIESPRRNLNSMRMKLFNLIMMGDKEKTVTKAAFKT